jgi:hypothetical protein
MQKQIDGNAYISIDEVPIRIDNIAPDLSGCALIPGSMLTIEKVLGEVIPMIFANCIF